ncbi:MAG: 5-(carboxyamino)imidazole ribonucleotide synthase [Mesorhizobium sp.]|nr:5-(carboxyamino)imidazole ribonucleotide synthase [Mesorhizobium sp.]
MTAALAPGATIGIIGGGQLGRMLAMAAARLGYRTIILEPQADCPAAQVANAHLVAAYDDADALAELARRCDVVTFEFENVPLAAANDLEGGPTPLYPPSRALEVAQDRLTEKKFLNDLGISTARFHAVDSEQDAKAALQALEGGAILKTRRLGYDGKGQARLSADSDAAAGFRELGGVAQIMEAEVDFDCEISIVAARDAAGQVAAFEPARNVHRDGILRSSSLPSSVALATEDAAREIAFQILAALDYVGVIGVEFFVMRDGAVLVNEIAPRVHNSGHWTEAACAVSQFEQHIRAICGLPLGSPFRHSDCVMENLIGDDIALCPQLFAERGVVVHLYGKAEARPGRKMGHFTRLLAR